MRKNIEETKAYHRIWYAKNREKRMGQIIAYKRRISDRLNEYKSNKGCKNCDEKDYVCLDFHHRDSMTKEFNIGQFIRKGAGWEKIMIEINKCDVLCSNCHRKEHFYIIKEDYNARKNNTNPK